MKRAVIAGALQSALVVAILGGRWSVAVGCVAVTSILVVMFEAGAQRADDRRCTSRIDRVLGGITGASMGLALLGGPATLVAASPTSWRVLAGCAVAIAGGVLRAIAIATLGAAFVTEACAPDALVTHGIFAHVRHPSELGAWLVAGGFALAAPGWVTLAGLVAVLGSSLVRIRREDVVLARAFGAAHRAYRTRALLPW